MSEQLSILWCLLISYDCKPIGGLFQATLQGHFFVDNLKVEVKEKRKNGLEHVDASNLTVWKSKDPIPAASNAMRAFLEQVRQPIIESAMDVDRIGDDGQALVEYLLPTHRIRAEDDKEIYFLVQLPKYAGSHDQRTERNTLLKKYDKVFIRAGQRSRFRNEDIQGNNIEKWPLEKVPGFVQVVDDRLKARRDLAVRDKKALLREFDFSDDLDLGSCYVFTDAAGERESRKHHELMHTMACAGQEGGIEKWKESMETASCAALFFPVAIYGSQRSESAGEPIKYSFGSNPWPWKLLVQVPDEPLPLLYSPKSDVSWWKQSFPRLLVEIYSKGSDAHERLHVQSGAGVRLANLELREQKQPPEFVLFALYIDADFVVHRYLFFEAAKNELKRITNGSEVPMDTDHSTVYYTHETISLCNRASSTDQVCFGFDRLLITSQLYNFVDWMEDDKSMAPKEKPNDHIKLAFILQGDGQSSFSSRNSAGRNGKGTKGGDTKDIAGHGPRFNSVKYELVVGSKPLFQQHKNIYRVRRIGDASKTAYVAKRLHPDLDELEILQELATVKPRCDHIIRLIETIETNVGRCIVLPELKCVADQLYRGHKGGTLRGHYINLSRDLARAVTFLHDHGIAHLDIKPPNMLYTVDFRLQLIDFDLAVRVKDENEMIEGYNGTERWKAPEIGSREGEVCSYSPMKADLYSCGASFEDFLDFGGILAGEDEGLRVITFRLKATDPEHRPHMRIWIEPVSPTKLTGSDTDESKGEALVGV